MTEALTTDAERIISSLNQQYGMGTLRRNMEIVVLYRIEGWTMEQIGNKYGMTRQNVQNIIARWERLLDSLRNIKAKEA